MPRHGSESDSSHRGRSKRKKSKKSTKKSSRSSSASLSSRNSSREKPKRYRIKSRSRSHSRDRKSRSKSHEREFSSRSSSHKRSHRKYQKRRSTSRHRSKHDKRSSSRSRGRRSKRSPSNSNSDSQTKISKYSRSSSVSPRRSKPYKSGSDKPKNMTEDEILKAKLQAAFKAAATADALLREKGLIPDSSKDSQLGVTEIAELTIDEQMKRAQAIEDINASSFVQQDFKSTRTGAKKKLEPSEKTETDNDGILCADSKSLKLDDSWKSNAEKLVHPNLFKDIDAKMDRWKEKLAAMRSKRNDADSTL